MADKPDEKFPDKPPPIQRKPVLKSSSSERRRLSSGDPLADDLPDFSEGVKIIGKEIDLWRVLPHDIYNSFTKDLEACKKAVKLTRRRPDLQAIILKQAPHFAADVLADFKSYENKTWSELNGTVKALILAIKAEPYAGELLVKIASKIEYRDIIFANFDLFKDQPYAEYVLYFAVKADPNKALEHSDKYIKEPYGEKYLEMAAKLASPEYALSNVAKYVDEPYAESVVSKAAEKDPRVALYMIETYGHKPWAKKIIEQAARKDVNTALRITKILEKLPYGEKIIRDSAKMAARLMSEAVVKNFHFYRHKPWAKDVLKTFARDSSFTMLSYLTEHPNFPDYEEWLEYTIRNEPDLIFLHYFELYKDKPYLEEIFILGAKEDPYDAFNKLKVYEGKPFEEKVVMAATESNPEAALNNLEGIENKPYFQRIVEKVVEKKEKIPARFRLSLLAYYKEKQKQYYKDLEKLLPSLSELAALDPTLFLQRTELFESDKDFKEHFERAVVAVLQTNLEDFFALASLHRNSPYKAAFLPYMDQAIERALQEKPEAITHFYPSCQYRPDFEQIYKTAVDNLFDKNPVKLLELINYDYDLIPGAIIRIGQKTPEDLAIEAKSKELYAKYIKPRLESVLRKGLETEPQKDASKSGRSLIPYVSDVTGAGWVLALAPAYINEPYAEEIIKLAAAKEPFRAAGMIKEYFDNQPYVESLLWVIAKANFFAILSNKIDFWKKPYAKEVIHYCEILYKEAEKAQDMPMRKIKTSDFPFKINTLDLYFSYLDFRASGATSSMLFNTATPMFTIPAEAFKRIFYSENFQQLLREHFVGKTYMNAFSFAQALYQNIQLAGKDLTDEHISAFAKVMIEQIEQVKDRELFGPNTQLILFTHEEDRFDNGDIIEDIYLRAGGRKENILASEKGIEMKDGKNLVKERVLAAIRNTKGPVTILFSGHGSPEHWAFARNSADNLIRSGENLPNTIHYKELGDALAASGNIRNINLIGCTCFSYDYIRNLFDYLEKEKGIADKPHVAISEANKSKFGWGGSDKLDDTLLTALYDESEEGQPITVENFFRAEGHSWEKIDPVLFVNGPEQKPLELSEKNRLDSLELG